MNTWQKAAVVTGMILSGLVVSLEAEANKRGNDAKPQSSEKVAREILAEYQSGEGDWKARMEALVKLVGMGPKITPALAEAMQNGSSLGAQAAALLADANAGPAFEKALHNSSSRVRAYAVQGLSLLGRIDSNQEPYRSIAAKDRDRQVRYGMAWAFERDDSAPAASRIRQALGDYDVRQMDSARLDELAPEFSLSDAFGKAYRLSDFRGKKSVILRFYREPI